VVSAVKPAVYTSLVESEPHPQLAIQDAACGHQQTLRLAGEVDLSSAPMLDAALRGICAAATTEVLLIDLERVTFMDSTGLRALLVAKELCANSGIELRLLPGTAQVQRLFEVAGMTDQFCFAAAASTVR